MFKALILQASPDVSWSSLGLALADTVPDANTIWIAAILQ
jgi:hypothetical protein